MGDYDKLIKQTEKFRFKKGVSGNPGGRRKQEWKLLELARESVPDAFRVAHKFLMDEGVEPRVRLDAAKFLVAYGVGAPPKITAETEPDVSDEAMSKMSVEELRALARQSLADEPSVNEPDDSDDSDETEH